MHAAQRAGLRHLYLAAEAEPRRRLSPAMPARTASSSSSSCANTATRSQILGGFTPVDESLLQQMGDDALGAITGNWYSAQLDYPDQQALRRGDPDATTRSIPASMRPRPISAARCSKHALKAVNGKVEDKDAFMKALQEASTCTESLRGPMRFDEYGNVVGNIYIRKVETQGRQARQRGGQDLSGCQPVLDLQAGRVPEEAGLFARLSRRRRIWSSDRFSSPLRLRRGQRVSAVARRSRSRRPGEGSAPSTARTTLPRTHGTE